MILYFLCIFYFIFLWKPGLALRHKNNHSGFFSFGDTIFLKLGHAPESTNLLSNSSLSKYIFNLLFTKIVISCCSKKMIKAACQISSTQLL